MQTRNGRVLRWFQKRAFGIFETKDKENRIERFWAHVTSVKICVPDEVTEGCYVKFDVDDTLAVAQGKLPVAINIEVAPAPAERKGEGGVS